MTRKNVGWETEVEVCALHVEVLLRMLCSVLHFGTVLSSNGSLETRRWSAQKGWTQGEYFCLAESAHILEKSIIKYYNTHSNLFSQDTFSIEL